MTCETVYKMAGAYLAPTTDEAGNAVDYRSYVPGILNGIALELSSLADEYCRQKGMMEGRFLFIEAAALSDPLPLPDRFAPAAALSLAALLCLRGNESRAKQLRELAQASVDEIRRELSAVSGEIIQFYG